MHRLPLFLLALVALVLPALPAASARANGVPQLVKLTYLDGISNYGPTDGEGVLEFSFAEAYARVEVKHLVPADGVTYEGWMVAPDGSALRIGEIAPNASGIGSYETKIQGLDRYDYNLFVIAARTAATPADAVPSDISIAGRFTLISDDGSANPNDIRPTVLPDTGEKPAGPPWTRIAITATVMAATAMAAIALRRRAGRNEA